jgi:hypothetical protein
LYIGKHLAWSFFFRKPSLSQKATIHNNLSQSCVKESNKLKEASKMKEPNKMKESIKLKESTKMKGHSMILLFSLI